MLHPNCGSVVRRTPSPRTPMDRPCREGGSRAPQREPRQQRGRGAASPSTVAASWWGEMSTRTVGCSASRSAPPAARSIEYHSRISATCPTVSATVQLRCGRRWPSRARRSLRASDPQRRWRGVRPWRPRALMVPPRAPAVPGGLAGDDHRRPPIGCRCEMRRDGP